MSNAGRIHQVFTEYSPSLNHCIYPGPSGLAQYYNSWLAKLVEDKQMKVSMRWTDGCHGGEILLPEVLEELVLLVTLMPMLDVFVSFESVLKGGLLLLVEVLAEVLVEVLLLVVVVLV